MQMTSSESRAVHRKGGRPRKRSPTPGILRVTKRIARNLKSEGAEAVVLMGSHVRGDFYSDSDIDIWAIGKGPFYRLDRIDDNLVSISWRTVTECRKEFRNPASVGGAVPGWRSAIILHDPKGVATSLKKEAVDWDWDVLGMRREKWVAEELTGWTEEVHRLIGNLELRRPSAAAIQRSVLAIRLAPILAVHHRIMYDTENRLWDLVGEKLGEEWSSAQSAALGLGGESLEKSCRAALRLFILTAKEIDSLLDDRQRRVVEHACEIASMALSL